MKKYFLIILLLHSTIVLSQEKKTYNVGVLTDSWSQELRPIFDNLETQVKSVVGEDATIIFRKGNNLVNNQNLQKAQENYNQLLANDTDIILAFGPINSHIISNLAVHEKPTILFGAVNRDFNTFDITKETSGVENFTYLLESESYHDDFVRFKELTGFKNVGIAIEAELVDILPLKVTFDKEFESLEAGYKLIPFTEASDIIANLDGIDAIYMAGGFFLSEEENKQLAKIFIEKKLPSFTINGTNDVQNGIMATNQSDENIDQFFRRIALSIEAYVTGTPLADLPVYLDYKPKLTINYHTAEAIGVPMRYSLIGQTSFVGESENAISEKRYSLLIAIDDALKNNLSLRSNQKDVALSGQDVKVATSNYLPSLTASGTGTYIDPNLAEISNGQSPEFSTAGNITLQQTIFSEAANANIAIQKSLQKAQEENFNSAELDLIFNTSNLYFNVLILKANTQIQLQNLALTRKNLEIAEQNFEAGQAGKSDLLRFRSQLAQNQQSMVEAINQLEQGFIGLNQVLNNPIAFEIDVEEVTLDEGIFERYNYTEFNELLDDPTLREPFVEFLIEEANRNSPELRALDYNLDATERNIKLNGFGRLLPTFALQGQYNNTFSRSGVGSTAPAGFTLLDNNYNAVVSVSIPLVNQNLSNINKQTAMIQKEQLEISKENTQLAIATNLRSAILDMVNQVTNMTLSKVSEETAKEALELTQTSYSNGAVNIVQLLDAQNNYLTAQLSRTNATYNFLINSLQLERHLGYYFVLNSDADNEAFRQRFFEYMNTQN